MIRSTVLLLAAGLVWSCQTRPAAHSGDPLPAPPPAAPVTFDSRVREMIALLAVEETREDAREQIAALGAEAVGPLIETTEAEDEHQRWEAVNLLGRIGDARATEALVARVLSEENAHVRWRSLWALARVSEPATVVAKLLPALESEDPDARWRAALGLSMFGSDAGLPILHETVRHPDPFRRWEAINALGRVHGPGSVEALETVLRSPSVRDRNEAVLSLGHIGGPRAVALLVGALEDEAPDVRWRAAMALGKAGGVEVVPRLKALAVSDADPQVREHAGKAAGRIEARAR